MGALKEKLGDYDSALYYANLSLQIKLEDNNQRGISIAYCNIGNAYYLKKDYSKAIDFNLRSLDIAQKLNYLLMIREASKVLHKAYKQSGNYKKSLKMHELYVSYRDSTINEENKRELMIQDFKYNYQKKALADSIRATELLKRNEAKLGLKTLQNEKMKLQAYYLYFILFIVLLLLIALGNRFILVRKQKRIIEEQKAEVDAVNFELVEKNNEVQTQAEQLYEVNEEIKLINENLEQSVQLRTEKIELQNTKLKSYAFSNSHEVRAPLARIMGLVELLNYNVINEEERKLILEKISESSHELDAIIREVNITLDNDNINIS